MNVMGLCHPSGMMECWSIGIVCIKKTGNNIFVVLLPFNPSFQYSIIPIFQLKNVRRIELKNKALPAGGRALFFNPGNDLLSHSLAQAVPSALEGLTSVFGMGTGISPLPWSPETYNQNSNYIRITAMIQGREENEEIKIDPSPSFLPLKYLWSSLSTD